MKTIPIAAPFAGSSRLPDSKQAQTPPPRQSWRSRGLTLAAKSAACLAAVLFAGLSHVSATDFCVNPGFEDGTDPAAPPWSFWAGTGGAIPNPVSGGDNTTPRVWSNFGNPTYVNVAAQNNMNDVWLIPGATYHVHAQYYIPSSEIVSGTDPRAGIYLSLSAPFSQIRLLDPRYPDNPDNQAPATIPVTDAWYTYDFDWVCPATDANGNSFNGLPVQNNYTSFRIYGGNGTAIQVNNPGGYMDNCQFSSDAYTGTVSGFVKDSGGLLEGAAVAITYQGSPFRTTPVSPITTLSDGAYSLAGLIPGETYSVTVSKAGYVSQTVTAIATEVLGDITLELLPATTISGTVVDGGAGVVITAHPGALEGTTLSDGSYEITGASEGVTYTLTASNLPYGKMVDTAPAAFIAVAGANPGNDFTLKDAPLPATISGTVIDGGAGIVVTANPGALTGTTLSDGTYEITGASSGTEYTLTASNLPAGKKVATAPAAFTAVAGANAGNDFTLMDDPDYDPDLLYSARSSAYTGGSTWPTAYSSIPGISSLATMGSPTVRTINGQTWAANKRDGDGFRYTNIPQPGTLPFNGGTIVVAARPIIYTPGNAYQCLVSNLLFQFSLCVQRDTGQVRVFRRNGDYWGPYIPNGQITVFSLVVQANGQFKLYLNGDPTPAMNITDTSTFSNLTASEWYGTDVSVGKGWNGDGWSSFNGDIGDVLVYKTAIDDAKREALEDGLIAKFGTSTNYTITASAGTGGTISPAGDVAAPQNADTTFVIYPSAGYAIADVVTNAGSVMGSLVPTNYRGGVSYTFTNVTADDAITVTFAESSPAIRYEAENSGNTFFNCGNGIAYSYASGGLAAGKNSSSIEGGFTVNNVTATAAGMYNMTVGSAAYNWNNNFERVTYVKVNGIQIAGSFWTPTDPGMFSVLVPLKAGSNTITIYNPANSWGPHWDYIDIAGTSSGTAWFIEASVDSLAPNGTISPVGSVGVADGASRTFTITPDFGYAIADVAVDVGTPGESHQVVGTYTFDTVTADHTIVASFSSLPLQPVSGNVSDSAGGIVGATVYFSNTSPALGSSVTATTVADPAGNYSLDLPPGDYYIAASAPGHFNSTELGPVTVNAEPVFGNDFILDINPNWDILFSATVDQFSSKADGDATGNWTPDYVFGSPAGAMLTSMATPTIATVDGVNWIHNDRDDTIGNDGYELTGVPFTVQPNAGVDATGVSVVAVVQPIYKVIGGEPRGEIVNLYYNGLSLCVDHATGEIMIARKAWDWQRTGTIIPDGQKTIVSLVCQLDGSAKLYVNGQVSSWPGSALGANYYADLTGGDGRNSWQNRIGVGRNPWDGWSSFNGNIADVYVYKDAISNAKRKTLQSELATKFGITLPVVHTITATPGSNGTISPSGDVDVAQGQDQTFNFYPTAGFVDVVTVDGIDEPGHPASYTFFGVTGPHTISVTFTVEPPPPNDNFVDAIDLTGVEAGQTGAVTAGTQAGTYNFAATKEVDEPAFAYVGPDYEQSVWFKWTAPSNGNFTIDTYGSMNVAGQVWDSVIYLYDGASLASLNSLATVDNGQAETATIPVTTGTTYYVRLAWGGGPSGNAATQRDTPDLHLTWSLGAGGSFAEWAAINAGSQTPGEDYNNDGVANGVAYFMGVSGIATNPGLGAGNTVIWPMSATFSGDYEVQTSPDLGTWINVTPKPLPVGGNLSYTLPPDLGKQFVRLLVIPD